LNERYRVPLPRGFWTWEVEGARVVALSALTPHNPVNLTRRPAWMRVRAAAETGSCAAPPDTPEASARGADGAAADG
jgi:hypothetical protein